MRVPTVPSSSAEALGPELEGTGELGGFDPKDLREAYNLPETGGSSQTVAVVDEYDDPHAEADLKIYREKYKLPECTETTKCFEKINQNGENKNYPPGEYRWAGETSLDLDMVSAACGQCHILLVEANAATETEFVSAMLAAEKTAYNHETYGEKTTEISNSWDVWEFEGETSDDSYFNHPGVPITFASGDFGYSGRLRWPGSSPDIISVGATKLTKVEKPKEGERAWTEEPWRTYEYDGERRYAGEKGAGTTSGCSKYEKKPEWQKATEGCELELEHEHYRTDVDVAVVGAAESPVSAYDSYEEPGWANDNGTSASAPFMAGVEALSSPYSRKLLGAHALYLAGEKGKLFDVTKGGNGECGDLTGEKFTKCHAKHGYGTGVECGAPETLKYYLCHAEIGYDGPTGWGAPDGPLELASAAPTVTTKPATSVTETGATLNGTVDSNGAEAKYYFEYGTSEAYGSKTAEASAGAGESSVEESQAVTGLTLGTKYDARIVATNGEGTSYGKNQIFTVSVKPTATTYKPESIGETTATLAGIVNPKGAETKYYFEYGTTESYGSKTAEVSLGSGISGIEVSKALTGLTASTTYYVRVVASNSDGTTDGANKTFSTTGKPSAETTVPDVISEKEAKFNGVVNPRGAETKYYFQYSTEESFGHSSRTAEVSAGSGTSNLEESATVTGLTPKQTYYFRIVATNSKGTTDGNTLATPLQFKPANGQGFTSVIGTMKLLTELGESVVCEKGTAAGTVTAASTVGKVVIKFTGCKGEAAGKKCELHSTGAQPGEIVTDSLRGELGTVAIKEATSGVGLLLEAESAESATWWTFASNECPFYSTHIYGLLAGEVETVGKKSLTNKFRFSVTGGSQSIKEITMASGEKVKFLGLEGWDYETATTELLNEVTFGEATAVT